MILQHEEPLVNTEPTDTIIYLKGMYIKYCVITFVCIIPGTWLFHNSEWDAAITTTHSCTLSSNALISSAANLLIGCCHAKQVSPRQNQSSKGYKYVVNNH